MAKTNFTKVEGILEAGILKMSVNNLLDLADVAQGMGKKTPAKVKSPKSLFGLVERELLWIYSKDPEVFKNLHLKKKKIKKIFDKPEEATPEDVEYIKTLKEQLAAYKKEKLPHLTDDDLVKHEQDRHINKRYNTNEGWLPLK
jgi:hypothetical protein